MSELQVELSVSIRSCYQPKDMLSMNIKPLNIGQILSAQARIQPDKVAAQDLSRQMNYRRWNERACQLANALRGLGLAPGDRVAVLAYNRVEWAEIYAATAKSGLVTVPINFRLTGSEVLYILEDSGASALIVEETLIPVVESIREQISIPNRCFVAISEGSQNSGWHEYEQLMLEGASSEPDIVIKPDDPWCLMYTSGTTGNPKGAIRGHCGMAMLALMTAVELGLTRDDNALLVMPMFHANSLNFFTAFTYCGGTVSIFSRKSFDPELCLRTFAGTGATFSSMVPTHYSMLLDVPHSVRKPTEFERVEKLMISSAPARADTKRAIMEMFVNSGLFELYGSTEAGWVTMLHPHEQFDKLGTVGREVVGSAPIRLMDEFGDEVSDGRPGELFSSSPYSFDGYWNLPEKTAQALLGVYVTIGDIAVRDSDGFIRLIDRKNNLIISGGENIYPSEVETALADHPEVREVAVVGRPDPKWGERVCAVIVPKLGSRVKENDLFSWANGQLAPYKRPREIVFLTDDEMPRNATGKILHRTLREVLNVHHNSAD